jgi:hypothetical protein
MDRVASQTLRVLGIVAISIVIIVAALIFAIASACGVWSSSSTADQGLKLVVGIGCPVILIGGIFLIAKLAKGIGRTRREAFAATATNVPVSSVTVQPRDFAAEEEPLLHLRIAVGARILLSAAMLTYQQVHPSNTYGRSFVITAILGLLVYEAPNGFILWRIRERLERFAVLLAIAYGAVSIVWMVWNFMVYMRFIRFGHNQHTLATWLLPVAAELAIVITGWRARAVLPRQPDDDSTFAAAGAVAFVYTFLAYGITNIFYRMRPF